MSSEEFGIERYIDLAKEQELGEGSQGSAGDQSTGPLVLYSNLIDVSLVAGVEQMVSENEIDAGLLLPNDLVRIEWWGIYQTIDVKIYWNNTLLDTIAAAPVTQVFATTLAEIIKNYISVTTIGAGLPSVSQSSSKFKRNWKSTGGNIRLSMVSSISTTTSVGIRIIRDKQ